MDNFIKYLACKSCGESGFYFTDEKVECSSCGSKYKLRNEIFYTTDPSPSVGSKYARQESKKNWSKWRHSNYEFLKKKLKNFPDHFVVVDLGCGESPFGDLLERFKDCLKVDFTPYKGVNIVSNLNGTLPIKSESVDIVIASNVLEHIPDTNYFLSECNRIIKDGGFILITVPFMIPLHQEPFDFLRFTQYQLEYLLNKAGFLEIEIVHLSNFFEVYQSIQNDFLNAAVNQQNFILFKFFLRMLRKTQLFVTNLMFNFFEKVSDKQYPKGYGIVAKKKSI